MRLHSIIPIAACLGLLPAAALADQIVINFTATVNSVSDANNHLTTAVNVGDVLSGTVSYNTDVPGTSFGSEELFNATPGSGYYFNITATVDGITFQSSSNYYEQDSAESTVYQFTELKAAIPPQVTGYSNPATTYMQLGLGGTATHPLDQPTSLGPLSSYTYKDFDIQYNVVAGNDLLDIDSTLTSLSTTDLGSAPEPGTIALSCAGLALVLFARGKGATR